MVLSFMHETTLYELNKDGSIRENIVYVNGISIQTV